MRGEEVDPSVGTVLLFGGSFDPPHKGHVQLPLMAVRHLEQVQGRPRGVFLLFVPAARSPHKQSGPLATDAQRLEMLERATGHLPRCGVWTDELERAHGSAGPSYTIDTVRRLRGWLDAHGGEGVEVRLLIGQDQAEAFDSWRQHETLAAMARPLVFARRSATSKPDGPARLGRGPQSPLAEVVPVGVTDASSSAVRAALAGGTDVCSSEAARMLDPQVLAYIRAAGLYGAPAV